MYCDKIMSESKNIVSVNLIYAIFLFHLYYIVSLNFIYAKNIVSVNFIYFIICFRPFATFSCKIIEFNA